jgi:transcriptional regulator with PAS, ATPase and Fis domain
VCQTLRKLAPSDCEILLTGETGVGKEVYARAVHEASRRTGLFVAINCAALPRELVESELFGYVRGAHSQARESKRGLFEESEGGTLFLDEVGEMPADLQTKLLRFLQDRQIVPLGSTRARHVDTRVLAATSHTAAPKGSSTVGLRADLAARLGAEPIRLPPLRHRIEDLGALIAHFIGPTAHRFDPLAFQALALHTWPGNVRELEKVIGNAELLARDAEAIGLDHIPVAIADNPSRLKSQSSGTPGRPPPPSAAELEALLLRFHGNVLRVARELGRTPPLIYRWCRRFKLEPERFRQKD